MAAPLVFVFFRLSFFPYSSMKPQAHPCIDECFFITKDGTGNEAKWVLWEEICDEGIYYRLLKHLSHVFIHCDVSLSYISQLLTLYWMHLILKSEAHLLSNFLLSVCICLICSYIHTCYTGCGPSWCLEWICLRTSSVIHAPSDTFNVGKCLSPLHGEMTDST